MFSTGIVFIAIILVILTFLIFRNLTHLNQIPKPPCNIFLGHTPQFKEAKKILNVLTNYRDQYGDIIRIYVPPVKPSVLITDAEVLQIILSSNKQVAKARDSRFLQPWLGNGLLISHVDTWRQRRRLLMPCFGNLSLLKDFTQIFDSYADILIRKLDREVNKPDVDIFPLIKMYSLDVICETSMGVSMNAQNGTNRPYVKSIEDICSIVLNRIKSAHRRFDFIHYCTDDYKKQMEAVKIIDDFFYDIINAKKQRDIIKGKCDEQDESKYAFLDLLLKFYDEKIFTIDDIRDEVHSILFGGHDTTATGIAFTLYILARHPKVQEKVLHEQLNIFGKLNEISPGYDDLQNMKYLELVIYEALRLFPPIPLIFRKLTNDIYLKNGIKLPKNLNVGLFIYGCHRSPKYFSEPDKFIPERFEESYNTPYTFLPFSAGPRNCIGKKFAIFEMKSCISKIIRNFILYPCVPEYVIELSPRLTLVSENGIRLSLERRIHQ